MGKEIERKFLVKDNSYRKLTTSKLYKQGYLYTGCTASSEAERNDQPGSGPAVRVRICDNKGFITFKSRDIGITRLEYEYEIPLSDAEEMLDLLCIRPIIEKYRFKYEFMDYIWEIDEFHGENEGLVIAEIELENENDEFSKPDFIAQEVTGDFKYHNSNLIKHPYKDWKQHG